MPESLNARKKILFLSIVSFLIACNYFILKSIKETLLVTSSDARAEAIPFVKMWLLFPATLLFLGVFTGLASRYSIKTAVLGMVAFFLASYAVFTFILYPFRESIHLHQLADEMLVWLPEGWKALAAVVRYWSYSFFYVVAECWCTMVYSVIFWGYANAVISFADAKKFYPYLTLAGTTAALIAGPLTIFLTSDLFYAWLPLGSDKWDGALIGLTTVVLFNGLGSLWILAAYCPSTETQETTQRLHSKPALWVAFINLFKSRYLLLLAGMCLAYNFVINMTDVVWKNEVVKLYPDPNHYTSYLSYITIYTGIVSTLLTLFVTKNSLKKFGWTKTALITPFIALITGGIFFLLILGAHFSLASISMELIALFGSIHICLSSAGKYTFFEPTKEMAFIPLSSHEKLHGKAIIDGVGARLGKTASSLAYQVMLVSLPTITACIPYVSGIFLVFILGCLACIMAIGKQLEPQRIYSPS